MREREKGERKERGEKWGVKGNQVGKKGRDGEGVIGMKRE